MRGEGLTGRAAAAATRHPWRILGLWVVLLAGAIVGTGRMGSVITDQGGLTVETESSRGQDLIDQKLNGIQAPQEFILVESDLKADSPVFTNMLAGLVTDLRGLQSVTSVVSPLDGIPGLVSADGDAALVVVTLAGDREDAVDTAEPVVALVGAADQDSAFRVTTAGPGSLGGEFNELAEETLARGEMLGIPTAIVILILVFGAAVAAGIPLLIAAVSVLLAFGLTFAVGQVFELSFFVINMIVMIGLALGIDYTLFVVQRYREERAQGYPVQEAVVRAAETSTRAVVFSALTVVIALTGLMYMPDIIMRSLGIGAILVVAAAALAAVTALPAMLTLLGDRVNRLRVPFASRTHYHQGGGRFWHRVTRAVTSRPALSVVLSVALLLAAAVPFLTIDTGQNGIESLPEDSTVAHAFTVISRDFNIGVVTTPIVVAASDVTAPPLARAVEQLTAALAADPNYGEVTIRASADNELLVIDAATRLDPSTVEARAAVDTLRADLIPAAFAGTEAEVLVTGEAAFTGDYARVVGSRSPVIFVFVLGLSFLLLMLIFRSIVVPLKAVVMNLLSVGAAYGLLVLVFQHGVGADWLGFQRTDVIDAWIPMFLFTVLFGLSMDYHIFLLSRIRENWAATGDNIGSVAFGLGSTGAIITGAALIMVAVFGGFAAGDLVMFQQMGFGLAVAVILDASIVRSVLVPATMALLGARNWYLPRWLNWLPQIRIESTAPALGARSLPASAPADS